MLTTLLQLFAQRSPADYDRAFVQTVSVREPVARDARVERLLLAGWMLIMVKCLAVIWIIGRWSVPFHPYWIILPTILLAALGTAVYYWRRE
ncbi:MAG: hypothetical protein PHE83_11070 [Opitutaceae bacterium]|nr:hypothetical protein [Opitutaceae bacterium]